MQKHLKLTQKIRSIYEGLGLSCCDIDREYEENLIKVISELKNKIEVLK